MECTKWADAGLLFVSGEAGAPDRENFRKHLSECESCRLELSAYDDLKRQYFSPEILGDSPSPATDREILRVCSRPVHAATMIPGFSVFFRKAALSAAFLFAGFAGVGYYAYVMHDAQQKASILATQTVTPPLSPAPSPSASQPVTVASGSDSIGGDTLRQTRPFSATRGSMPDQGVRTVGNDRE